MISDQYLACTIALVRAPQKEGWWEVAESVLAWADHLGHLPHSTPPAGHQKTVPQLLRSCLGISGLVHSISCLHLKATVVWQGGKQSVHALRGNLSALPQKHKHIFLPQSADRLPPAHNHRRSGKPVGWRRRPSQATSARLRISAREYCISFIFHHQQFLRDVGTLFSFLRCAFPPSNTY